MIKPFRFWCNKVLPLVYDDSLSYYELLCKVVDYLNKVINQTNETVGTITALVEYINHYFDSPEFEEMVNQKLDEMAASGELDAAINGPKMFVPNRIYREAYKDMVLRAGCSYIYYQRDSKCVSRLADPPASDMFYSYYNTKGKGWQSLVAKDSIYYMDFDGDDTIDGTHVLYCNCGGLVTLLTMGRDYKNSPYYQAFNPPQDPVDLKDYCCEIGNRYDLAPWTFDFLQWHHTYQMYYIMQNSGCEPNIVYDSENGGWDESVYTHLESGDILFAARDSESGHLDGIHHCMLFVKSIDDLNALHITGVNKFYAYPFTDADNSGTHGYIIHCTFGYNGTQYLEDCYYDAIRIESLNHYTIKTEQNHAWQKIYVCKPYANPLNSNKRQRTSYFMFTSSDELLFGYRYTNGFPSRNKFVPSENKWYLYRAQIDGALTAANATLQNAEIASGIITSLLTAHNLDVQGAPLFHDEVESVDLDEADNGVWSWGVERTQNISHLPPSFGASNSGLMLQFGRDQYLWYTQIVFGASGKVYYRSCRGSGGERHWSDWCRFTTTVDVTPDEPEEVV